MNHFHFKIISFTDLNRRTETNDNYCKLEIKASALKPLVPQFFVGECEPGVSSIVIFVKTTHVLW